MTGMLSIWDWWDCVRFHLSVSLLAVGGAVSLVPDLHRFLVVDQRWLSDGQFTQALVLAQAAPGPNVLYVALLGWQVGQGASVPGASTGATLGLGLLGSVLAMVSVLLPSSCLTLAVSRWCARHGGSIAIQAFRQGMAPIVIGLLLASSWLLAAGPAASSVGLWGISLLCVWLTWRTRLHLLWLLAAGGLLGGMGWV